MAWNNFFLYKYAVFNIWDILVLKNVCVIYPKFRFNWAFHIFSGNLYSLLFLAHNKHASTPRPLCWLFLCFGMLILWLSSVRLFWIPVPPICTACPPFLLSFPLSLVTIYPAIHFAYWLCLLSVTPVEIKTDAFVHCSLPRAKNSAWHRVQ